MLNKKFSFYDEASGNSFVINNVITQDIGQKCCASNITVRNGIIEKIEHLPLNPQEINEDDFYLTPGFVNSHLHPNQLFDRGILDDLAITSLLSNMHKNSQKTFADRYIQSLFTLMDAVRSGATSIYAVASEPEPVIQSFKFLNLSGAVACFFNDQWEGLGNSPKQTSIKQVEKIFADLYQYNNSQLKIHIGSSSIQSASDDLLLLFNDIAKNYNTKVNIHISEGSEAVASCIKHRGTTPIRLLKQLNVLNSRWNLIHATTIDEEEIKIIADSGAAIIHCPVSNAKTGVGIAPITELIRHNVTIGLGTDACSNNNTNNILNEAYFAKLLQCGTHKNPMVLTEQTLLEWLTINGYKMLDLPQHGILTIGEPANLLIWSLKEPAFVPLSYGNFNSTIFNNAPDIKPHSIILNGKRIINNYKFIYPREEEILREANNRANKIVHSTCSTAEA